MKSFQNKYNSAGENKPVLFKLLKMSSDKPVSIILDTDIGNDIDDALAIVLLHAMEYMGECKLLGIAINKDNKYSPVFTDIINTFYGRFDIPIAIIRDGKTPEDGRFLKQIVEAKNGDGFKYNRQKNDYGNTCAIKLYRRILASQPDNSVSIVSIGFFTNLARLLTTCPDEYSPLNGIELVSRKVRLLSAMAGNFNENALSDIGDGAVEFNIKNDIVSAHDVCTRWPGKIVFSGLEVGEKITFPSAVIEQDLGWQQGNPVSDAYRIFKPMPYDRPLWDLTSVLYAVRGQMNYFGISQPGIVNVADNGFTGFKSDSSGNHKYLTVDKNKALIVRSELVKLCTFKPEKKTPYVF